MLMASDLVRITLARFVHSTMPPWPLGDFERVTMLPSLGKVWKFWLCSSFAGLRGKCTKTYQDIQNGLGMSENSVYSQWNSHLIGIMIMKTIGYNGVHYFQTNPFGCGSKGQTLAVFEALEHDQCFTSWLTPVSEASLRTPRFSWNLMKGKAPWKHNCHHSIL